MNTQAILPFILGIVMVAMAVGSNYSGLDEPINTASMVALFGFLFIIMGILAM